MISFEYRQFLNEKVLEYLPPGYVKVGDKINLRCPICGDSRKSSTKKRGWWYMSTGSYYCFNCSTGMSGIKFLQFLSGQDYDVLKREYAKLFLKSGLSTSLSATYEIPKSEPSLFEMKQVVKPEWKKPLTDEARSYLHERMVDVAPFYNNNLYSWFSKKGKEYILIDWVVNGVDAYFQLNDFQKHGQIKYIFPKDLKKVVYGLDNIDVSWPYIIVFEGVYDSLFVKNGVATGTKGITDYQLKLIKSHFPKHQIVIAFDNDEPGMKSMKKLVESKNNDFKFFLWFNQDTKQKDINERVIFSKDVNMFSDSSKLEYMIVNKLIMKMHLIKYGFWKDEPKENKTSYDSSPSWKTRKIF